jgi:hypothetical protein
MAAFGALGITVWDAQMSNSISQLKNLHILFNGSTSFDPEDYQINCG